MAYFGLSVNMVIFMFYVMHKPFSSSSNAVNNFLGISQVSSVFGGFLADAYLGRYWTIAIFTTIYLVVCCKISIEIHLNLLKVRVLQQSVQFLVESYWTVCDCKKLYNVLYSLFIFINYCHISL